MRTTVSLDDLVLKRAKQAAAARGVSLARLVEDAVRAELERKPAKGAVLELPVSTAQGGLRPGVDLRRNESLWEALEAEDAG
ncbi:MAG: DUF2191 domain-containing protein [Deltaproteobacteria bacterium]|nr:DUF2191 domain-containing protein [Deltaproteobacteria bacterium]